MDAHWTGQRPEPIPVVPERLAVEAFGKLPQVIEQVRMGCLPLGLDIESVQPVSHDFSVQSNLAVFGDQRGRLLGLKRSILNSLKLMCTSYRVLVVDSAHICKEGDTAYWGCIRDAAEFPTTRMGLLNEIATAQKGRAATIDTLPRLIYITDIEAFEQDSYATEEELATLLRFGAQANLFFILAGEHRSMSGTRSGFSTLYREWLGAALFCMKASYQEYSKEAVYLPREAELEEDSAYLMQNNQLTLLRHLCVDESLEQKTY